jgi:hypothetical protein
MKNLIILIALLLYTLITSAQIVAPTTNTPYAQLDSTRHAFLPLFDYAIPTGIIGDINSGFGVLQRHAGSEQDAENSPFEFLDVVQNLKNGAANYDILPTPEIIRAKVAEFKNVGIIPISFINYKYATFTDTIFDEEIMAFDSVADQYHFTQDPTAFLDIETTCAFAIHGTIANTNQAKFVFPSDLYFTNYTESPNLMVDFGDGNGWRIVTFNVPFTVDFPPFIGENRELMVKIKFNRFTKGLVEETVLKGPTVNYFYLAPDLTLNTSQISVANPCFVPQNNQMNEARFYVRYGKAQQTSKQLKKPFILVEGFDLDINPHDNKYGVIEWSTFIEGRSYDENNKPTRENLQDLKFLAQRLFDENYDCILVDFKDGAGDMFKNGNALIKIIQWANQNKTSDEELVVLGASMGGLLARYALRTMELEGCNPCTKLYGTFDSPHQGANVPVALQYAIKNFTHISTMARDGYSFLYKPAAQQMLMDNLTDANKVERNKWQNHLDAIGHPQLPKRIALTNGSPNGSTNALKTAGDKMLEYHVDIFVDVENGLYYNWAHKILSAATLFSQKDAVNHIVYDGETITSEGKDYLESLEKNIPDKNIFKKIKYINKAMDNIFQLKRIRSIDKIVVSKPLDNASGGQSDWTKLLIAALNNVNQSRKINKGNSKVNIDIYNNIYNNNLGNDFNTTFVPTYSGLDMVTKNYNPDLKAMFPTNPINKALEPNTNHPFHAIFIHSDKFLPFMNQQHVFVDHREDQNIDFIMNQLKSVERKLPSLLPTGLANQETYNYNQSDDHAKRIPSMTITTSGILHLNKDGYGEFGNGIKPSNTDNNYIYRTNGCASHIVLQDGGRMVVGDDNNVLGQNNRATLYISAGSILEIKPEGFLSINKGSKVIIEEGAMMIVHSLANIQLLGTQADLEVKGYILVKDGATLKLDAPNHDKGTFTTVNTSKNEGKSIRSEGANSEIELTGNTAWQQTLLHVKDGPLYLEGFKKVTISKGQIAIEANAPIVIKDECEIKYIKFDIANDKGNTLALQTFGQANQVIELNEFNNLEKAVDLAENTVKSEVKLNHNIFDQCDFAITATQCKPNLSFNLFKTCGIALKVEELTALEVQNNIFKNNGVGLMANPVSQNANYYLTGNLFKNNVGALEVYSNANLTLACNRFYNNTTAINGSGTLNLSTSNTIINQTGGNNTFFHNENSIVLNDASLFLENGFNNFIADPNWGQYNFVTGLLSATCNCVDVNNNILVEQNYWFPTPPSTNMNDAGAAYYQLTQNTFPHPNNMEMTGTILDNIDPTCFDTEDEELDNDYQFEQNKRNTQLVDAFSAKLYPNPFTQSIQIEINLTQAGQYSLYLYNALGQEVWSSRNTMGKAGINKQTVLTNTVIPAGAYQLKLVSAEGTMNQTVIKK